MHTVPPRSDLLREATTTGLDVHEIIQFQREENTQNGSQLPELRVEDQEDETSHQSQKDSNIEITETFSS